MIQSFSNYFWKILEFLVYHSAGNCWSTNSDYAFYAMVYQTEVLLKPLEIKVQFLPGGTPIIFLCYGIPKTLRLVTSTNIYGTTCSCFF